MSHDGAETAASETGASSPVAHDTSEAQSAASASLEDTVEGAMSDAIGDEDETSEDVEHIAELVEFMARALVDKPDGVNVQVVEADRSMIYELSVDEGDLGKVIGKEGRTARAMRQILAGANRGDSKRPILDIVE